MCSKSIYSGERTAQPGNYFYQQDPGWLRRYSKGIDPSVCELLFWGMFKLFLSSSLFLEPHFFNFLLFQEMINNLFVLSSYLPKTHANKTLHSCLLAFIVLFLLSALKYLPILFCSRFLMSVKQQCPWLMVEQDVEIVLIS